MGDPRTGFHPISLVQVTPKIFQKPTFIHKAAKRKAINTV